MKAKVQVKTKKRKMQTPYQPLASKGQLRERGISYADVAKHAGVSWWMVWAVVNGRKRSAPVLAAIEQLTKGRTT